MSLYSDHLNACLSTIHEALAALGHDGLLIYSGHPPMHFLDDHGPHHKVNPHFNWLVPDTEVSHSLLHLRPGHKPRLYLSQPADFWHKVEDRSQADWCQHFDLRVIAHRDEFPDFDALTRHVWIGPPVFQPLDAVHTNPPALLHRLHHARTIKSAYEIDCMARANALAWRGHLAARDAFHRGDSEYHINMAYLNACASSGHEMPYGNIVACNENAAVLHYQMQSRDKVPPRSFLIDAGAQHNGYAADITRTYAAAKDGPFAELIAVMDEVQQSLCAQAVSGCDYVALHIETHRRIGEVLQRFKLINCSAEAALEQGITRAFFPHGLGHFLGLQVHDVNGHIHDALGTLSPPPADHPFLRLTHRLKAGMVLTIEPGLYFIDMLLKPWASHPDLNASVVDALRPFGGIRIEDNVVVRDEKPLNLTRAASGGA